MGIVQDTENGFIRPITPCCKQFIGMPYQKCESCGKPYPDGGSAVGAINNVWIEITGDPGQFAMVERWLIRLMKCDVSLKVDWPGVW